MNRTSQHTSSEKRGENFATISGDLQKILKHSKALFKIGQYPKNQVSTSNRIANTEISIFAVYKAKRGDMPPPPVGGSL